jgi:hypothetical protein
MPGGRPLEYKEQYVAMADTYLAAQQDEVSENGKLKVNLPTIEGFALFLGVNKTSLYEWEKLHPEFSNALNKIRTEQQQRLLNSGLSGDYNSTIAKLVLSANHGMREKTETDITSGGKPIPIIPLK